MIVAAATEAHALTGELQAAAPGHSDGVATLHTGAIGTLENLRCSGWRSERTIDGYIAASHFGLPYAGSFVWHTRGRDVFADANQLLYLAGGEEYAVSHPSGGDSCMIITPNARAMDQLVRRGARKFESPAAFPVHSWLANCEIQMASRLLRAAAEEGREALELDELLLDLMERLLDPAGSRQRALTSAAQRTLERAKSFLHAHATDRLTLKAVAYAADVGPIYLTQLFKRVEGIPLYQYAVKLRLAAALHALRDCDDITGLALDLGFSSHSHFTAVFTSRFGVQPSTLRAELRGTSAGQTPIDKHRSASRQPIIYRQLCEARGGRPRH